MAIAYPTATRSRILVLLPTRRGSHLCHQMSLPIWIKSDRDKVTKCSNARGKNRKKTTLLITIGRVSARQLVWRTHVNLRRKRHEEERKWLRRLSQTAKKDGKGLLNFPFVVNISFRFKVGA